MPATLAIETSQRAGGVALRASSGECDVEMLAPHARHDDDLLPAIDRLCRRLHTTPRDLGAVGVSIGPGGFTGLRIAVSTAKMLAETTGARLVGVPSALVAAESTGAERADLGPLLVALCAKSETFWGQSVRRLAGGAWELAGAGGIVDQASFRPRGQGAVIADEHFPDWARDACARAAIPVIDPRFDPLACLRATERLLHAGHTSTPLALLPIYPRPPEAVTIWERRQRGP